MTGFHDHHAPGTHASDEAEPTVAVNRADRRAKRRGKSTTGQQLGAVRSGSLAGDQVAAQPRMKGKRGNR